MGHQRASILAETIAVPYLIRIFPIVPMLDEKHAGIDEKSAWCSGNIA
jgi:hypothetical protein